MSIWDENWIRTEKSLKIDNMLREKITASIRFMYG